MGLFQWLAPDVVWANRPWISMAIKGRGAKGLRPCGDSFLRIRAIPRLICGVLFCVGTSAYATPGWMYGYGACSTAAVGGDLYVTQHNGPYIDGFTYYFSLSSANETTGLVSGTYYSVNNANGWVGTPVPWSHQLTVCDSARPVEVEPLPQTAGNGNSCQRPPDDGVKTPNPIIPATGEKVLDHQDYAGQGPAGLSLTRNYRSGRLVGAMTGPAKAGLGQTWSHNHAIWLKQDGTVGSVGSTARVFLGNSSIRAFHWDVASSSWKPANSADTLVANSAGLLYKRLDDDSSWQFNSAGKLLTVTQKNGWTTTYAYSSASTPIGIAPAAGLLISVSNQFGRTLQFTYNATGQLTSVTAPGSQTTLYGYDGTAGTSRLTTVSYPATTGSGTVSKSYLYENTTYPSLLTGIIDEKGIRLATYAYDSQGRATSSQLAQGVELYSVSYPALASGATIVTDPLGTARSYNYGIAQGKLAVTGADKPSGAGNSSAASRVQDANGFVTQETDFLGVNTMYTWDITRRLPLSTIKAAGLPEAQTSTTQWHATYRLPVLVTEAGRTTAYTYDSAGNTLSQTVTDTASNATRTTSWTYNSQGLPATETNPNSVVTRSYAYYAAGSFSPLPPPDPFDSDIQSVSVLLHGDGTNNSTVMADSAPAAKTVTAVGGAKISTVQSKFGGSAMAFDGAGDYLTVPASPGNDFNFGTGDFTIEAWIYPLSLSSPQYQSIFGGGSGEFIFLLNNTSVEVGRFYIAGIAGGGPVTANTWQHVAVSRTGTTLKVFIGGVQKSSVTDSTNITYAGLPRIGGSSNTANFAYFNGYLDDLRVTKGVGRYTASFTPPTLAFPHNGPPTVVVDPNAVGHMAGDLESITNAVGHVTQFTLYDRAGRVRQMIDSNGVVTNISYTPRGWVNSVAATPPGGMARTTTYTYDNAGQLTGTTLPDGTTLGYSYDAAHRLTSATDAKGNTITYTLDAMGNKVGEQVKDSSNILQRNITRVYDALNRVQQVTGVSN
jgi:YD repeat-containing protein